VTLAVVVGMPTTYVQRIRASLRAGAAVWRPDWQVEYVATGRATPEIGQSELQAALAKARTVTRPHIIGVSKQDGAIRQNISRQIKPYFRFVWLRPVLLSHFPHDVPGFIGAFNTLLEMEESWDDSVRPREPDSPLLLPGCSFSTTHRDMWAQAEQYGSADMIRAAARTLSAFKSEHWVATAAGPRRWVDDRGLLFDHTGAKHYAHAPFPRSWKYSLQLPSGFHYDVTSTKAREFGVSDMDLAYHLVAANAHINIDAHGKVL
jgi:hypothetical protein